MEEKRLLKTYAVGMLMLALFDEWSKMERIGVVAKIYNQITAKHDNFYQQIHTVQKSKKKKCSKKCALFIKANGYAISAWEKIMQDVKNSTISANTTILNLFRLDNDSFRRIYVLDEELFLKLHSKSYGVTLQSCKVARLLLESLDTMIANNDEVENILE